MDLAGLALDKLHKTKPLYDYQIDILRDFFSREQTFRIVMLNCGRKFSKTFISTYFLWRHAIQTPNGTFYYVAPTATQGEEILWQRLLNAGPHSLVIQGKTHNIITRIRNSHKEIWFFNGSKIKIVGATGSSVESLRGCEPHAVVYEEYKDHDPLFHEAMHPNYAVYNAQLLIIGTPPKLEDIESGDKKFYQTMMDYCEQFDDCKVYSRSSLENPDPNIHSWLLKEQERLMSLGKAGISMWEREYEGKLVYGGETDFLPQFSDTDLIDPFTIEKHLSQDLAKYRFAAIFDPSGSTRWGALFLAINKEEGSLIVLDALTLRSSFVDDAMYFTHEKFFELALEKVKYHSPKNLAISDWKMLYDYGTAFQFNVKGKYKNVSLSPVNKNKKGLGKLDGFSAIKDLKLSGKLLISRRAAELISEFKAISLDRNGMPVKKFDELTDCLRYAVMEFNHLFQGDPARPDPFEGMEYFERKIAENRDSKHQMAELDYYADLIEDWESL